jgi:hypothetical protein
MLLLFIHLFFNEVLSFLNAKGLVNNLFTEKLVRLGLAAPWVAFPI